MEDLPLRVDDAVARSLHNVFQESGEAGILKAPVEFRTFRRGAAVHGRRTPPR